MSTRLAPRIAQSDQLHRRVWSFAAESLARLRPWHSSVEPVDGFEELACDIASFQIGRKCDDFAQLVRTAVPADCFKFGHVFQFPAEVATCSFRTSGTTAVNTGVHLMRDAATYQRLSLAWGELALGLGCEPAPIIVALAPWTGRSTTSSLGYMMQRMMERFDARSVCERRSPSAFQLEHPLRWLVSERGIDVAGLSRVAQVAKLAQARVVLLATSFALVELVDALGQEVLPLPSGSTVMPTGGFKGRTRTIEPDVMKRELLRIFGDIDLVGEYGMTELTSQLYEGTARSGQMSGEAGVYLEPPWLRVVPCDPIDLEPVRDGDVGLACFVDLGNVDSAVALLTQDLVRREGPGIRLLGRSAAAPIRGCSLAIEALLRPASLATVEQGSLGGETSALTEHERAPDDAGRNRVKALVASAQRCKRWLLQDEAALTELATSSFMSCNAVRLAMDWALETEPTSNEIDELVARARSTYVAKPDFEPTVWVVLSSTVFTAAHRAAALALSISSRVKLKPSRRQPHFAQALARVSNGLFEIVLEIAPAPGDVVMVFGSDETIASVRKNLPSEVAVVGYGHGMGVAFVAPGADLKRSAQELAIDMLLFEQQGCLSPRLVLVDAACNTTEFVALLSEQLLAWNESVPPGQQIEAHVALASWERRVAQSFAQVTSCGVGWIAQYTEEWCRSSRLPLSSSPRTICLVHAKQPLSLLAPITNLVTCVGFAGEPSIANDLARCLPRARRVPLGMMQRPRFDGPVDLR